MSTLELEHIKHSSSSSNNLSVNSDGTIAPVTMKGSTATLNVDSTSGNANALFKLNGITTASIEVGGGNSLYLTANNASGNIYLRNGSSAQTNMTIDSVGRVTKPFQPSFSARGQDANWRAVPGNVGWSTIAGTSYSNTTGNYQMGTNFTTSGHYGAENIGNHFTNASGHFTAPVAGHYFFQIRMYLNRTTTYSPGIYLNPRINSLLINGGGSGIQGSYLLERTTMSNSNNAYIPFGREDIYYMAANDTFTYSLNAEDVGFQIYGQYTEFKGYMIG